MRRSSLCGAWTSNISALGTCWSTERGPLGGADLICILTRRPGHADHRWRSPGLGKELQAEGEARAKALRLEPLVCQEGGEEEHG
jgi:hypothetical protein